MNFEGFKDLIQRVAIQWYALAKKEIIEFEAVEAYLAKNPFTAEETASNSEAYERLMASRCKLYVSLRNNVLQFRVVFTFLIQCICRNLATKLIRIMTPTWSSWNRVWTSLTS